MHEIYFCSSFKQYLLIVYFWHRFRVRINILWFGKYDPFFNFQYANISHLVKNSQYQSIIQFLNLKQRKFFSVDVKNNFNMSCVDKSHTCVFFQLLFGCPTANFGPFSRGQPHSPDVYHSVFIFSTRGHQEPRNEVGSLSPAEPLVGFEAGTFDSYYNALTH